MASWIRIGSWGPVRAGLEGGIQLGLPLKDCTGKTVFTELAWRLNGRSQTGSIHQCGNVNLLCSGDTSTGH
jgi:hypothetical protein